MARSTLNRRDRGRAASMKLQAKMAEGHWTPLAARQAGCPVAHVPPLVPRRPARQVGTVVGRPDAGLPTDAPFPTGPSIGCIRCRRGCGDAHGEQVLICDRRQPVSMRSRSAATAEAAAPPRVSTSSSTLPSFVNTSAVRNRSRLRSGYSTTERQGLHPSGNKLQPSATLTTSQITILSKRSWSGAGPPRRHEMILAIRRPRLNEACTAFGNVLVPGHIGAARAPDPTRPRGTECRTSENTGLRRQRCCGYRGGSLHGKPVSRNIDHLARAGRARSRPPSIHRDTNDNAAHHVADLDVGERGANGGAKLARKSHQVKVGG